MADCAHNCFCIGTFRDHAVSALVCNVCIAQVVVGPFLVIANARALPLVVVRRVSFPSQKPSSAILGAHSVTMATIPLRRLKRERHVCHASICRTRGAYHFGLLRSYHNHTISEPQSSYGDNPLIFTVICPRKRTVLKGTNNLFCRYEY